MPTLYRPTYTSKTTGEKKKLKKWYALVNGKEVPLSANKRAAEMMLARLVE